MTDATNDLEARLFAFAPLVHQPQLVGDVTYTLHDTAVGRLLLAADPVGLVASTYAASDEAEHAVAVRLARAVSPRVIRGSSATLDEAREELDRYLAGRLRTFDLPIDTALMTPFQAEVLQMLARSVPYGSTTTYGQLARWLDRPQASRAVGAALGANPLCVVFPCHRVVGSDGSLTGYAGGVSAKRLLLDLESSLAVTQTN
jgi:methylated-DNA-[protein]-cysteine S-methyltransferase